MQGYQITVACDRSKRETVVEFFELHIEGVVMEADGVSNYINFGIPTEVTDLSVFLG